jgi:nucleotide-binding universal stress UspA family protein
MPIRQALLWLSTFPDVAPEQALESACSLVHSLGARLTALLPQLNSDPASWPRVTTAYPVDFGQLMAELVASSESNAATAAKSLTELSRQYAVTLDLRRCLTTPFAPPTPLVDLARLHDLVILPVPESDTLGRSHIQAVLFDSGRPVVLLPSSRKWLNWSGRILVAWDYSREAARALSDALPILATAKEVHVVTVFGEKPIHTTAVATDLEKFLAAHGIKYDLRQVSFDVDDIGDFLMRQAMELGADMLVMGAYGHSRLQEFIFGGATRTALLDPALPLFLSH